MIGKNGSGYTVATKTQAITVSAWSPANTWYYDAASAGGNGTTSALSGPNAAYADLTTLTNNVSVVASGDTQIYFARGSHWISTAYVDFFKTTGLRVSPTPGSVGANPIMECATETSSPGNFLIHITTSSSSGCADVVISSIDFKISGNQFTGTSIIAVQNNNADQTLSNIYFDNCSFTSGMSGGAHSMNWVVAQFNTSTATGNFDGFGIWGGSINSLSGDATYGEGFFGGARNWTFMVGLSNINGIATVNGTFSALAHHIYASIGDHALYRWINFGSSIVGGTATRNYCIKLDNYSPPQLNVSAYSSGAGGKVRLAIADTSQYTNGANVYIEGVTGAGASSITPAGYTTGQGVWVCSIVDGTHIDLVGTTFTGNPADYTGGAVSLTGGTNYFCVDGNNITGTQRSFDSNNNYGNINASWQSNYVIQNNAVHDMAYAGMMTMPICKSLTYRYNRHWGLLYQVAKYNQGASPPQDHTVIYRHYQNKFYTESSISGGDSGGTVMFFANGVTWINPQTFTDNIMVDMRAGTSPNGAGSVGLVSYASASSWMIDRNQFYAPNANANKFLYDGSVVTAFGPSGTAGTWQNAGFDPNGQQLSQAPAGWTLPVTKWSDMG